MAYLYYIDKNVNCVFVQHHGEVSYDEMSDQVIELLASPDYSKGMNLLRDLTRTALHPNYNLEYFSNAAKERILAHDEALGEGRKAAWVLGNADDFKSIHQFSAIYRLNTKMIQRQPFRDVKSAMQWLGLPEDYEIKYPLLEEIL